MSADPPPTLLCTANFPAGAGYAWDFIESLYAGVADRLADRGIRTLVAYPALAAPPAPLAGSAAEPIENAFRVGSGGATRRACELAREMGATVLYMADRPAWHPGYAALRKSGVQGIVVHDHTSGLRTPPTGLRRVLKRVRLQIPGMLADQVIAVSDFVARRKIEVDLVPPERVVRIWNSIDADLSVVSDEDDGAGVRAELGVEGERPIIVCACRASEHKGVHHVLNSFDALPRDPADQTAWPVLIYAGDGPEMDALRRLCETLRHGDDVHFLGYRTDVPRLIDAAAVCVVPSIWAEAFGLAALEPMAQGRAVIASAVGGLPEVVADGESGLLVPPGDEPALTVALQALLGDSERRRRMGEAGRRRVVERFERGAQLDRLAEVIGGQFPVPDSDR